MLRLASLIAAAGLTAAVTAPASAESYTTRIEPRPFYGATVTLEEGVRVFRPLPPTRHVIINPNNTPVYLSHQDVRVTEERTINNYAPAAPAAVQGSPSYVSPFYFARGFHDGRGRFNNNHPGRHPGGMPAGGHGR